MNKNNLDEAARRENRQLWAEKLRSGDYKQTYEVLRNRNGYCCLGVLCDMSGAGEWVWDEVFSYYRYRVDGIDYSAELPPAVVDMVGLVDDEGVIANLPNVEAPKELAVNPKQSLAALNDYVMDFNQIAEVIESEPAGLVSGSKLYMDLKEANANLYEEWYAYECTMAFSVANPHSAEARERLTKAHDNLTEAQEVVSKLENSCRTDLYRTHGVKKF